MIQLDGAQGEGGGQILRSALSLAMCTQTPFRIVNIRAGRSKPGLMRQHLAAVNAAAAVCGGKTVGAELGSQSLDFTPGKIRGGEYTFAIGSAGSCTLVLQTLLPALLHADAPGHVTLQGGTHNSMAPPFHFLARSFLPLLARMGMPAEITLERFGFYPAGGGRVTLKTMPRATPVPLHLDGPGERTGCYAEAYIAGVPAHVAKRELETLGTGMGWTQEQLLIRQLHHDEGPGNVLLATLEHEHVTEVFSAFGERGVLAEKVADSVLHEVREYIASGAAVGEHLADQLLLPMALAGGGSFSASSITPHTRTNMEVIRKFLDVDFVVHKRERCWSVHVNVEASHPVTRG